MLPSAQALTVLKEFYAKALHKVGTRFTCIVQDKILRLQIYPFGNRKQAKPMTMKKRELIHCHWLCLYPVPEIVYLQSKDFVLHDTDETSPPFMKALA